MMFLKQVCFLSTTATTRTSFALEQAWNNNDASSPYVASSSSSSSSSPSSSSDSARSANPPRRNPLWPPFLFRSTLGGGNASRPRQWANLWHHDGTRNNRENEEEDGWDRNHRMSRQPRSGSRSTTPKPTASLAFGSRGGGGHTAPLHAMSSSSSSSSSSVSSMVSGQEEATAAAAVENTAVDRCRTIAAVFFGLAVVSIEGLQRLILSAIVATLLVAALQAAVALFQYRSNPQGQLAIPPGPTVGMEYPLVVVFGNNTNDNTTCNTNNNKTTCTEVISSIHRQELMRVESTAANPQLQPQATPQQQQPLQAMVGILSSSSPSLLLSSQDGAVTATEPNRGGGTTVTAALAVDDSNNNNNNSTTMDFLLPPISLLSPILLNSMNEYASYWFHTGSIAVAAGDGDNDHDDDKPLKTDFLSGRYGRLIQRVNRFLVLLLPLLVKKVYILWLKWSHLMDIGIVLTLVQVVDSVSRRVANCLVWPNHSDDNDTNQAKREPKWKSALRSKLWYPSSIFGPTMPVSNDHPQQQGTETIDSNESLSSSSSSSQQQQQRQPTPLAVEEPPPQPIKRVLVLGDSLAVGIGTINHFETRAPPSKGVEYWLIENTETESSSSSDSSSSFSDRNKNQSRNNSNGVTNTRPSTIEEQLQQQSPVFPRVLAAALASEQNQAVSWRSAGVDGGAVPHIRELLLPVLRQEVEAGRTPDCLVIMCGMNDLKLQFANAAERPWRLFSAHYFRRDLKRLFRDIAQIATSRPGQKNNGIPKTPMLVVLPAMPVQMFLKNTVVSIFPLSLLLDMVVGYWEGQKKRMADQFNSQYYYYYNAAGNSKDNDNHNNRPMIKVQYLPLSAAVVNDWYERDKRMTMAYDQELLRNAPTKQKNSTSLAGTSTPMDTLVQQQQEQQRRQRQVLRRPAKGFVSADGIHPNAKCYAFWAEYVAKSLLQTTTMTTTSQTETETNRTNTAGSSPALP
ncbi:hypothetical protein ACA910_009766 [Epithemia clementina (nom. ined.)]